MKKFLVVLVSCLVVVCSFPSLVFAQDSKKPQNSDHYVKGTVEKVVSSGKKEIAGYSNFYQDLKVKLTSGPQKGRVVSVEYGGVFNVSPNQKLKAGDSVVLITSKNSTGKAQYFVMDRYRLPSVIGIIVAFFVVILLVSGKKGFGAILGLVVSILVILKFIIPQILAGRDPLFISIAGALVIMLITIYLAHGISKKTSVALFATFITLLITGGLAVLFVSLTHLSGLGSEDSYMLQLGENAVNLKGLLLGGIIIGALGVLDDITTAQSASVFELAKANAKLTSFDLMKRGMNIGREHVSSLVNTLVLAYVGASMSLFLLIVLNPSNQPYWVIFNSELIVQEIVRTIAGSIGLTLAVPITTFIAAWAATSLVFKKHTKH